jgi:hypothetical protein
VDDRVASNRTRWLPTLAVLLVAVVVGSLVGRWVLERNHKAELDRRARAVVSGEGSALRPGAPFPDIRLVQRSGGITSTGQLVRGSAALVVFAGRNCGACAESLSAWSSAPDRFPAPVRRFVIIAGDPDPAAIGAAAAGIDWPIYGDAADEFGTRYDLNVFPTVVGVTADGRIAFVRHGVGGDFDAGVAAGSLLP